MSRNEQVVGVQHDSGANATSCSRWLKKSKLPPTRSAPACRWTRLVKAAWISLSVPALRILSCNPLDPRHFLNVQ